MVCYSPLKGWRSSVPTVNGKFGISFKKSSSLVDLPIDVPCGQCIGCRLTRSRNWAIRCVHEASLYDENCFLTLTYAPDYLPSDGGLNPRHFTLFMKRFRKRFPDAVIRYFQCGEYGDRLGRPHHHACIFGFDFPDKELYSIRSGVRLYRSAILESLWGMGFCTIGDVTFESAAYVARYITKKLNVSKASDSRTMAKWADKYMTSLDLETGEVKLRKPEYITMSRRPGIGRGWIDKFATDVYPSDFVLANGVKLKPPRYYDNIYDVDHTSDLHKIKLSRMIMADRRKEDNSSSRLEVRHEIQKLKFKQLKRSFEND